jgi:hypothetical protein
VGFRSFDLGFVGHCCSLLYTNLITRRRAVWTRAAMMPSYVVGARLLLVHAPVTTLYTTCGRGSTGVTRVSACVHSAVGSRAGLGVFFQRQNAFPERRCLVVTVQLFEQKGQMLNRIHEIWIERECLAIFLNRLLIHPLTFVCIA